MRVVRRGKSEKYPDRVLPVKLFIYEDQSHSTAFTVMESGGFKIRRGFVMYVNGPTASGKTCFIEKLLENSDRLIDGKFDRVIWCYGIETKEMKNYTGIELHKGPPTMEMLEGDEQKLLVLEDLLTYYQKHKSELTDLTTKIMHHCNCSIINVVQNLFAQDRTARTQCTYVCLMNSPADALQYSTFGRQVFGERQSVFKEALADAHSKPYSHLFIDLHPLTDNRLRILSDIFSEEGPIVYCER